MTQSKSTMLMPLPQPQFLRDISDESDAPAGVEGAPSVDSRFLNILPLPRAFDFSDLLSEVRRHRRLLVRAENAIPLTALFALFGALLFHGLLVGTFLIGLFIMPHATPSRGSRSHLGSPDVQTTSAGYMFLGDLNAPSSSPPDLMPAPEVSISPVPPVVTPPIATPPAPAIPLNTLAQAPDDLAIGIPSGNAAMTPPHADTPLTEEAVSPRPVPPSRFKGVPIQPPSTEILSNPVHTSSATHVPDSLHNGGNELASGSQDADDDPNDGTVIDLSAGSGSGGKGHSGSNGLDRGVSGADIPEPRMLDGPLFVMPADCHPTQDAIFVLTIRADGSIGSISLKQSSGDVTADAYCRADLMARKYWPAYKAGKPIESTTEFSYVK